MEITSVTEGAGRARRCGRRRQPDGRAAQRYAPERALSAVAEQLLLDAGRVDEAYARYAIQATSANTNIATYRAIAKRYPASSRAESSAT